MPAYISSIGTAVPQNEIAQKDILAFMQRHIDLSATDKKSLEVLYRASGVKSRYSVIADYGLSESDYTFFPQNSELDPFPNLEQRMALYESEAIRLAVEAVGDCMTERSQKLSEITHLITVSCTGMYAPGLDIDLVERLALNTSVARTNVNFMGCYAAFNGLKLANEIVCNNKKANSIGGLRRAL